MLCLALDTSTPSGRFALAERGRLVGYHPRNVTGSYANALLAAVDTLLAESGRDRAELGAIGVCRGPGSFTGVRIGVATAKALAFALRLPLHAVTTLEAMAAAMLAERPERDWAVPALDARRGEVFAGVYRRDGDWVRVVAEACALTAAGWWERVLAVVDDPESPVYAGSGAAPLLGEGPDLRPELAARGEPGLRCWSAAHPPTAKALALAMASPTPRLGTTSPHSLTPLYLRASDAEMLRGLDLTPAAPPRPPPGGDGPAPS
jgi:tRNA threonylcarbamoyladenosine biosynthesis protein TsaB